MNLKKGFPPKGRKDARVLILGSMPGGKSLKKREYYANPRNLFWKIMGTLFGFNEGLNYKDRINILKENKIALWDVIKSCERRGSLDTGILSKTIVENDFISFYNMYPDIRYVFFNGAKAEKEYRKRVSPWLTGINYEIRYYRLPSTSPAMNLLSFDKKMMQWLKIRSIIY
ncbi:MAG: DNA-deoxyinosine glycosylase [Deltaproteobacteria bacterium]|nr:DNA-deoxyinosine glycosylase [Deltaproteobacteria bacterium]